MHRELRFFFFFDEIEDQRCVKGNLHLLLCMHAFMHSEQSTVKMVFSFFFFVKHVVVCYQCDAHCNESVNEMCDDVKVSKEDETRARTHIKSIETTGDETIAVCTSFVAHD